MKKTHLVVPLIIYLSLLGGCKSPDGYLNLEKGENLFKLIERDSRKFSPTDNYANTEPDKILKREDIVVFEFEYDNTLVDCFRLDIRSSNGSKLLLGGENNQWGKYAKNTFPAYFFMEPEFEEIVVSVQAEGSTDKIASAKCVEYFGAEFQLILGQIKRPENIFHENNSKAFTLGAMLNLMSKLQIEWKNQVGKSSDFKMIGAVMPSKTNGNYLVKNFDAIRFSPEFLPWEKANASTYCNPLKSTDLKVMTGFYTNTNSGNPDPNYDSFPKFIHKSSQPVIPLYLYLNSDLLQPNKPNTNNNIVTHDIVNDIDGMSLLIQEYPSLEIELKKLTWQKVKAYFHNIDLERNDDAINGDLCYKIVTNVELIANYEHKLSVGEIVNLTIDTYLPAKPKSSTTTYSHPVYESSQFKINVNTLGRLKIPARKSLLGINRNPRVNEKKQEINLLQSTYIKITDSNYFSLPVWDQYQSYQSLPTLNEIGFCLDAIWAIENSFKETPQICNRLAIFNTESYSAFGSKFSHVRFTMEPNNLFWELILNDKQTIKVPFIYGVTIQDALLRIVPSTKQTFRKSYKNRNSFKVFVHPGGARAGKEEPFRGIVKFHDNTKLNNVLVKPFDKVYLVNF